MTEAEAKKKWCPFVRVPVTGGESNTIAGNREGDGSWNWKAFKCIGSDCMAWRIDRTMPGPRKYGYCGLAGKNS